MLNILYVLCYFLKKRVFLSHVRISMFGMFKLSRVSHVRLCSLYFLCKFHYLQIYWTEILTGVGMYYAKYYYGGGNGDLGEMAPGETNKK